MDRFPLIRGMERGSGILRWLVVLCPPTPLLCVRPLTETCEHTFGPTVQMPLVMPMNVHGETFQSNESLVLDVVLVPEGQAVAGLYEVITRDRDKPLKVYNIEVCFLCFYFF